MNGPNLLAQYRGRLRTRVGAFFVGERAVFRGRDLHTDLKNIDWLDLYVFGITGRRHSPAQLKLMHAIWGYTSYPDTRLWNNRVAALAATARSTANLGLAAALGVSEAHAYGRGVDIEAIDFLRRTRKQREDGASLGDCIDEQLRLYRRVAGYGRPLADRDERIAPMMALVNELGFAGGPHLRLAIEIEQFLLEGRWRWRMNYGALAAALGADLGLSTTEYYQFVVLAFFAGMPPCFNEAAQRPEGTLFPMTCSDIQYEGRTKRGWSNR
jgi:hypothetical protein